MDPVTELATRVAAYLWRLRDLFPEPEIQLLSQVPATEEGIFRRVREKVSASDTVVDYAMLARFNDVVSRTKPEAIDGQATSYALDMEDARNKDRSNQLAGSLVYKNWKDVPSVTKNFLKVLWRDDDGVAQIGLMIGPFPQHVARLKELLPNAPVPGRDAGPAESAQNTIIPIIAAMLVARESGQPPMRLWAVAEAINYVPYCLRGVPREQMEALLMDPEYPTRLIAFLTYSQGKGLSAPLPFGLVLEAELNEIGNLRTARKIAQPPALAPAAPEDRAFKMNLLGVAFSGGGIRSATFGLGILQTLAARGWLRQIDYLSTVSGGGYIGSWLTAWIKRVGSVQAIEKRLARSARDCSQSGSDPDPSSDLVRPVRELREFSNYLTPQAGFLTADTWTMLTTWLRNTILNLLVLALFLGGGLGLPQVATRVLSRISLRDGAVLAGILMLIACGLIGLNLLTFEGSWLQWKSRTTVRRMQGDGTVEVASTIALPLFLSSYFAACALWALRYGVPAMALFTVVAILMWLGLMVTEVRLDFLPGFFSKSYPKPDHKPWLGRAVISVAAFIGLFVLAWTKLMPRLIVNSIHGIWSRTAFAVLVALLIYSFLRGTSSGRLWGGWTALSAVAGAGLFVLAAKTLLPLLVVNSVRGIWLMAAFGPSVVLLIYSFTVVLYLGLAGYWFSDFRREWWSRTGAWLGLFAIAWIALACISFFGPLWIALLALNAKVWGASLGISWGAITAMGTKLAFSAGSDGKRGGLDRNPYLSLFIKTAPFVFLIGFLIIIAFCLHILIALVVPWMAGLPQWLGFLKPDLPLAPTLPFSWAREVADYWPSVEIHSVLTLVISMFLIALAFFLSWRFDVNEFSMHFLYRNRLVRAYLGASRARRHRQPNQFTGLDPQDDVKLWRFRCGDPSTPTDAWSDCVAGYAGPYPLINTALNLTSGQELAWQERKAHSFVFTPLYCGYDLGIKQSTIEADAVPQYGFRRTEELFAPGPGESKCGMGIGAAMAISGAAITPNWGYHTTPAVAFLLTVFNVRLGWWMGNPSQEKWFQSSPRIALVYLLQELAGYANADRDYIYLSDGGHFDNMGLYELVRRRCRFIVVCDAEEDENYGFEGLANAVRKCRLDFGVEILLDPSAIRPPNPGEFSRAHWAMGTVRYPGEDTCGTIVYLKSSIMRDDPQDVLQYRFEHAEFPHQSTANQFFTESQFESYRALGQHVSGSLFPDFEIALNDNREDSLTAAFNKIKAQIKSLSVDANGGGK